MDNKERRELEADPAIKAAIALGYPFGTLGPVKRRKQYGNVWMSNAMVHQIAQANADIGGYAPGDGRVQARIDHWNDINEKLTDAEAAWGRITGEPS